MADIRITKDGALATVSGETEDGIAFVDAWILGVLSVEDAGRLTLTSEAVTDLTAAAAREGLACHMFTITTREG